MSGESDKPSSGANASLEGGRVSSKRISVRPGGPESLIGTMLSGRYRIESLLGEGGMGAVYQVEHTLMHKRFAVKVLHPEMSRMKEVVSRFEREAMAAAHIDHPNVAAATDFGKLDDGSFFLVLEFVEGTGLRDLIGQGPLECSRAMHIVRQIASALHRAHALGIVHRDLKPENVMLVMRDGDQDFVKVLDFGIAKVPVLDIAPASKAGGALTQLGMVYGTPEYMAPEQALGQEVDARADLYSLGVIAFEMLAGVRPYDNESKVKLLAMHVTSPIPTIAERAPGVAVPKAAESIVLRLMSKEASERYADAKELIDAIDTAFGFVRQPSLPFAQTSYQNATEASADASHHLTPAIPLVRRRNWISPISPMWLIFAGSVIGIGLLAWISITLVRGAAQGTETTMGEGGIVTITAPHDPVAPTDEPTDDAIKLAISKLSSGDAEGAIAILTKVENDHPDRADVHKQLYLAYMAASNAPMAMIEANKWVDADPKAASDVKLLSDVHAAATSNREGENEAFEILETKLGSAGADTLYDLAFGPGIHAPVAARAKKSLSKPDVEKAMSPALAVTMEIYNGQGCEQKKANFERAREVGDLRTIQILKGFSATRGCGFLSSRDCWACMHRDGSLYKTITAIQARHPN